MKNIFPLLFRRIAISSVTILSIVLFLSIPPNSEESAYSTSGDLAIRLAGKTPIAQVADKNIESTLIQSVSEREYFIRYSEKKGKYQSPNRANSITAFYQPGAWELQGRRDSAKTVSKLKLTTRGIYADGKLIANPEANPAVVNKNNNIHFEYSNFTEEYINNEQGIRQNFIVHSAPVNTKKVEVALSFSGMIAVKKGEDIHFIGDREQWNYSGLKVWDATGKELDAEMKLEGNKIKLMAQVENAEFPVTIDPIIGVLNSDGAAATIEGTQANEDLGTSVAGAGDVNGDGYSDVIIGAPGYSNGETEEGVAFIYYGSATGISGEPDILEGNQPDAAFGSRVAGAGDINGDGFADVIIGAPVYDNDETPNTGAAFIFTGAASGIQTVFAFKLEGDQENALFGAAVSGAGDIDADGYSDVVIGSPWYTNGQNAEGAIFVYTSLHTTTPVVVVRESNQIGVNFGTSVSRAGDVNGDGFSDIIVGAPEFDNGHTNEGAAIIYHGSAGGILPGASTLLEINQLNARFGSTVSSAGDINGDGYSDVIVGSNAYDNGQSNEGGAFIYTGSASGVNTIPAWTREGNQTSAFLGTSVAGAGDLNGDGYSDIMIGAPFGDFIQPNDGMIVVAYGPSFTREALIYGSDPNTAFGVVVSGAGDVNGDGYADIITGAHDYSNAFANTGAAFVYHGDITDITASIDGLSSSWDYWTGTSISGAGDVNGDGFADMIVGGQHIDEFSYEFSATILLYYGSSSGGEPTPEEIIQYESLDFPTGSSTASGAGDINGDGFDDIIVNAIGKIFVYHGSPSGIQVTPAIVLETGFENTFFGKAIAGVGDMNGDGFADIAAGVPVYTNGQTNEGAIFVYHGSATGIQSTPAIIIENNQANIQLGISISGAGDVNGDGYADIIAGSTDYDNGQTNEGAAFIYYGSGSGLDATPVTIVESNQSESGFGTSVSNAGDINGDGFSDVLVGAPSYDNGQIGEGAVFVYYGSITGITVTSFIMLESNDAGARFGNSVSCLGDGNADGYADLIIGAPFYYEAPSDPEEFGILGRVYIFNGSESGVDTENYIKYDGYSSEIPVAYGSTVSGAGDVNGDGFDDFLIGVPADQSSPYFDGDYVGSNLLGYTTTPKTKTALTLYNTGTTTRIQQSNISDDQFSIGMFFKSADGRSKGKLVWETKSEGEPFSSSSPLSNSTQFTGQQPAFTDAGLAGTRLNAIVNKTGFATKIRVRIKYDPVTSLNGQVYGPWIYPSGYFGVQGMNASPLPVTWLSFTAKAVQNNQKVQLDWQTGSEKNNIYFTAERSHNTQAWMALKEVKGSGNSMQTQFYQAFDNSPKQGRSYYRIKQTDADGKTSYSETRMVYIASTDKIVLYPVPALHMLTIEGNKTALQQIVLLNSSGIRQHAIKISYSSDTKVIIDVSKLIPGSYYVQTQAGTYSFIKQ